MFTPIRTTRLVVRAFEAGDVDALHQRRNDPAVARYQSWSLPYLRPRVEQLVAEVMALDGPTDGEWWMATVAGGAGGAGGADSADGEILGDVVVHLTNGARTAEIGYTFAAAHWGRGYAVEAVEAVVDHLFATFPLTRVFGMLHPDNVASAMVLERTGFLFEGLTRLSYWLDDDNSDDALYGMTRADLAQWRDRPRHRPANVGLVAVTTGNARAVRAITTHRSQERFVAPVVNSFADALMPEVIDGAPVVPWMRAIEADGELVGFVMMAEPTTHHPQPYLWRLLIDRRHQRRGVAGRVLDQVADQCRAWGAAEVVTSWVQGRGSPEAFYLARGFEPTGRVLGGEIEGRRRL